jgi:hypothetical protein
MCQQSSKGDRIIIRFEVEIPAGVSPPQIVAPTAYQKEPDPRDQRPVNRFHSMRAECRIPYTDSVLFSASGIASAIIDYGRPVAAHAVVVHDSATPDPTMIDPGATSVPVNPDTGYWEFAGDNRVRADNVCNHQDPRFKMFIWFEYKKPYLADKLLTDESISTQIDCGHLPPCAAAKANPQKPPESQAPKPTIIEKLAYRWVVDVDGFVGRPVKAFNGKWLLKVGGKSDGKSLLLDNAEEKPAVAASVRLNLETGHAELVLRSKDAAASYFLREGGFRGDDSNVFRFADLEGVSGNCSVPMEIVLAPA